MSENVQFDLHNDLRKEVEGKLDKVGTRIDQKISDKTFWTVVSIVGVIIGTMFCWLWGMNERVTRTETRLDMSQPVANNQPIKK